MAARSEAQQITLERDQAEAMALEYLEPYSAEVRCTRRSGVAEYLMEQEFQAVPGLVSIPENVRQMRSNCACQAEGVIGSGSTSRTG